MQASHAAVSVAARVVLSRCAVNETSQDSAAARPQPQIATIGSDTNVSTPSTAPPPRRRPAARVVARLRRLAPPRWLILTMLALGIQGAYVFFEGAGKLHDWPTYNECFDSLAEGFRSGHLYMSWAPSPELLAADNPFDPVNSKLWNADLSLFKGHYYLYWGPVPALLLAAVKVTFRLTKPIGDQYIFFAFAGLQLVSIVLLLERMARRLFARVPVALVVMGTAVLAFANPMPYLLSTAGVYQTAIVGAQAFLLAGMVAAFEALWAALQTGRARRWPLVLAGVCWVAAIGCRASTGPTVLLLVALTALLARTGPDRRSRWKSAARDLALMATPVAAGVGLLLLYNRLRFDEWLVFGQTYQLNNVPFRHRLVYVLPNVYSYLLRPVMSSCRFPFIGTIWNQGMRSFPDSFFRIPRGYDAGEPLAGLLVVAPWAWLAPVGLVAGGVAWVRALREPGGLAGADAPARGRLWCAAAFAIIAFITILPVIAINTTTMRYLGDVTNGILLSGAAGLWYLYQRLRARPAWRRLLVTIAALLAVATVLAGVLLGFSGYLGHFRHSNPDLFQDLVLRFSFCADGRHPKDFGYH